MQTAFQINACIWMGCSVSRKLLLEGKSNCWSKRDFLQTFVHQHYFAKIQKKQEQMATFFYLVCPFTLLPQLFAKNTHFFQLHRAVCVSLGIMNRFANRKKGKCMSSIMKLFWIACCLYMYGIMCEGNKWQLQWGLGLTEAFKNTRIMHNVDS